MAWIATLPVIVQMTCLGIILISVLSVAAVAIITVWRGGKIKAGKIEIDGDEDDKPKADPVKSLESK